MLSALKTRCGFPSGVAKYLSLSDKRILGSDYLFTALMRRGEAGRAAQYKQLQSHVCLEAARP